MKIQETFNSIKEFLLLMEADPMNGWYTFQIGLPVKWICSGNHLIQCDIIAKTNEGVVYKLSPKDDSVTIDMLISFVEYIMEINYKIEEKEKLFEEEKIRLQEMLSDKLGKSYTELTELKENSLQLFGNQPKKTTKSKVTPVTETNDSNGGENK